MTLSYHSTKEPLATAFEYDLIAEIYTNYEMQPLWVKYREHVKLPVHDNENVAFDDTGEEYQKLGEYQKLKDFILEFEHQLYKTNLTA
jgi:hypothetical protein